jgi:ATP-dependent DNA ligase
VERFRTAKLSWTARSRLRTSRACPFDALLSAIKREHHRLVFFAFDVLHLSGEDLRNRELVDRRSDCTD